MAVRDAGRNLRTGIAGVIVIAFLASLLYGVLVLRSPLQLLSVWWNLIGLGLLVFVVYLFYRLVLAVERIADSM